MKLEFIDYKTKIIIISVWARGESPAVTETAAAQKNGEKMITDYLTEIIN
jgi:hypothetical protein